MGETGYPLDTAKVKGFLRFLQLAERSAATIEKYHRDLRHFMMFLSERRTITKMDVLDWKNALIDKGYAVSSINSMLAAVNSFFSFLGWDLLRVKPLRCQRKPFREKNLELTKEEYLRLLEAAKKKGDERLYLLIQTICSTGIRVSETAFVTSEAIEKGVMTVSLKGKSRIVFLPKALCTQLRQYARKKGIKRGCLFLTRFGNPVSRHQIWCEMKHLCQTAGVEKTKVFPHNLRHLFALSYYTLDKDLAKLADILGHSSMETTRTYVATSGSQYERTINQLQLVAFR